MKNVVYEIKENKQIADKIYQMTLLGDTGAITRPGQFVNLKVNDCYLRRPISVCDWDKDSLQIIYKIVGTGTEKMAQLLPGDTMDALTGLGNGYDTAKSGERPVLLGGGVGVPPLYALAKQLKNEGKKPMAVLGFQTATEVFLVEEFSRFCEVTVTTADGSMGRKGFVTNPLAEMDYTYFYACGPMPMFRAIEKIAKGGGQYSFEEKMGCGFGACMGCSCQTKQGAKRICKEGPVLEREEVVW
ncbi:MAG: dihydroorotate dehydrogenase electron transfer subunit [Clostridiales bacterium]|nr:dihydroorotate dehydrogenase electron transfer subunit [Clostridiales bacterium]